MTLTEGLKRFIKRLPIVGALATGMVRARRRRRALAAYPGSTAYWEQRYSSGGDSGHGSYGRFARFKAEVINRFVADNRIASVLEIGCGDGHQLSLAEYPAYVGLDVSPTAVATCRARFSGDPAKTFHLYDPAASAGTGGRHADLALSLDVLYHLTEDDVFERYMRDLFGAAGRFVIVYSSDTEGVDPAGLPHIRHRNFSRWVEAHLAGWRLRQRIPNRYPQRGGEEPGSFAEFFIYERVGGA